MVYSENIHWYQIVHVSPFSYLGGLSLTDEEASHEEAAEVPRGFPKGSP